MPSKSSVHVTLEKFLAIHLGVGFLSLSVCHQFGMNPFRTKASFDAWLMNQMGHGVCMIFAAFGAQLAVTFAGLWLLGGLIGGLAATEAVWHLKRGACQ